MECDGAENATTSGAGSWNQLHRELQLATREATTASCEQHTMLKRWAVVLVLVAIDAGTGAMASYGGRAATGDRRRWCYKHETVLL